MRGVDRLEGGLGGFSVRFEGGEVRKEDELVFIWWLARDTDLFGVFTDCWGELLWEEER